MLRIQKGRLRNKQSWKWKQKRTPRGWPKRLRLGTQSLFPPMLHVWNHSGAVNPFVHTDLFSVSLQMGGGFGPKISWVAHKLNQTFFREKKKSKNRSGIGHIRFSKTEKLKRYYIPRDIPREREDRQRRDHRTATLDGGIPSVGETSEITFFPKIRQSFDSIISGTS